MLTYDEVPDIIILFIYRCRRININYIDYKYMMILGSKLEQFESTGNDIFNFRCPLCFDSKKNKFKKRGYFYPKENSVSFKCHNCGATHLFSTFLKLVDFNLFNEYKLEKFGNSKAKPNIISDKMVLLKQREFDPLIDCIKLSQITDNLLDVKQYAINRGIPNYLFDYLYASKSLNAISNRIDKYADRIYQEFPVLVIPFFRTDNSYSYIQCRTITNHSGKTQRFTTFTLDTVAPKLWGEFRINWQQPVYILEGPIDAMFVNNAVALAGASVNSSLSYIKTIQKLYLGETDLTKLCFAYDNDYIYNDHILKLLINRIDDGYSVLLYDNKFKWKDINDAFSVGKWTIEEINNYIVNRTFQGLKAKLEISMLIKRGNH